MDRETTTPSGAVAVPVLIRPRPSLLQRLLTFVRRQPLGTGSAVFIIFFILIAIWAPVVAPHNPYEQKMEFTFVSPNSQFLLGTDDFGRDVLSRIIWGARISLYIGLLSTLFGTSVGAILGLLSGYFMGKTDVFIQRLMDTMLAFPMLLLALAIVSVLGSSITNVIIAISFPIIPRGARVIRSSVLSVKETQYVDAAKAIGCGHLRTIFTHITPNCLAPYIILATAQLASAILVEASLSFLGLGIPPPEPSWGRMLSGGARKYAEMAPWMAIYPGLAITLTVLTFNLFGDALRDVWDPRLRGA